MIRPFLLSLLLATPALAQDDTPTGQILEGLVACYSGAGDPTATVALLEDFTWAQSDGEDGTIYMYPTAGEGESTFVYLADDGSYCHTESVAVDSATASEILGTMLSSAEVTDIAYNKTADGCTQLGLPDGTTATITSGGNDPTCGSETDSGIRFDFAR
jgi:hypothetical protein